MQFTVLARPGTVMKNPGPQGARQPCTGSLCLTHCTRFKPCKSHCAEQELTPQHQQLRNCRQRQYYIHKSWREFSICWILMTILTCCSPGLAFSFLWTAERGVKTGSYFAVLEKKPKNKDLEQRSEPKATQVRVLPLPLILDQTVNIEILPIHQRWYQGDIPNKGETCMAVIFAVDILKTDI